MRRKYVRPQSYAAVWARRLGICGFTALLCIVILHRFGVIHTLHLPYFLAFIGLCAALSLILAFHGLKALWQRGAKGGLASAGGGFLGVVTLAPLLCLGVARFIFPPYADIATDFDNPPPLSFAVRPPDALPLAANFAPAGIAAQKAFWPQLSGRRYDSSPDTVLRAVLTVLQDKKWAVQSQAGKAGEDRQIFVTAMAKTLILGFVSDIVIRITDEGDTSFVDMRAASRYLQRDYGINARLAEDFLTMLDSEILSLPNDDGGT